MSTIANRAQRRSLLCALLAVSSIAYAQAPDTGVPPAGTTITLGQAISLAEEFSPRLVRARAQLAASRAAIITASAYPNPDAEAALGSSRARVPGTTSGPTHSIDLAQPIDLPSVRAPRIRAAEFGAQASLLAFEDVRLQLRAAVKQAFYDVLRRKAEVELFADTQQLLQETRNRIAVRVEVGEAAKFELVRADAELATATIQTESARLRVAQALGVLRGVIGAPLGLDLDVIGSLEQAVQLPSMEALRREALDRQPLVRSARADIARAEARLETERALRTPQPRVIAGVERTPEQQQYRFGIGLPIPIWNQRQGPIGEAVAAFQESTAVLDARRVETLAAIDGAVARYRVANQQIAAFEGGILKQAQDALRVAEAAFRFGERGFIDVLDAQRVLRGVRTELVTARFEQQAALIEIERLRAADLPID
jgi:outer membrane protein, heavy metal efflux system